MLSPAARAPGAIVAIGGSAGGIEPLLRIVSDIPATLDAALLVVIHVPPGGSSALPAILGRTGALPAVHGQDGQALQAGCIYVAPPDHHLIVTDGASRIVRGARENGSRPAIDPLFRSAAHAHGGRVVGVLLSGALDDGTVGLAEIKSLGGTTIVQDPSDATYPSMPESALRHVEVDYCEPAAAIGPLVTRLVRRMAQAQRGTQVPGPAPRDEARMPDEVGDGELGREGERGTLRGARPTMLGCPDCGGALWELGEDSLLRFRCRVGHAFTPSSLLGAQSRELEGALWQAFRTLDEHASVSERLAEHEEAAGRKRSAQGLRRQSDGARRRAQRLRRILQSGMGPRAMDMAEIESGEA